MLVSFLLNLVVSGQDVILSPGQMTKLQMTPKDAIILILDKTSNAGLTIEAASVILSAMDELCINSKLGHITGLRLKITKEEHKILDVMCHDGPLLIDGKATQGAKK